MASRVVSAVQAVKRPLPLSPNDEGEQKCRPVKRRYEAAPPAAVLSNPALKELAEEDEFEDGGDSAWDAEHYKTEIIGNLLNRESVRLPLAARSSYTPHRRRILDWMTQAKDALRICEEVHQLAVYFFDRFVDGASSLFLGNKLELYILGCIQLAAKTLEWDNRIPRNTDLNKLLMRPYDLSEYTAVERCLLQFFQWNVTLPVVNTFMGLFRSYLLENCSGIFTRNCLLRHAAYFETTTLKYLALQKLPPSVIASAIVYTCRAVLRVKPFWPSSLATVVKYTEKQLLPNVALFTKLVNNDNTDEAQALRKLRLERFPLTRLEAQRVWANITLEKSENSMNKG